MTTDESPDQGQPYGEIHPLRKAIEAFPTMESATVLSAAVDPFRLNTPENNERGVWLRDCIAAIRITRRIHNRGLHYAILSAQLTLPSGDPYANDKECWEYLEKASKAARWLGYVSWDLITDQRNDAPEYYEHKSTLQHSSVLQLLDVKIPDVDYITPSGVALGFTGRQRYHLVMVGEKSSLRDVLFPIAQKYQADLVLPTGNISDTLVHRIAKRGAQDGRRMVVLYFADCDPSGYNMTVEIGRKLQALQQVWYPELEFACFRVGLTPKQVQEFGLPQSPIKESDARGVSWVEAMGVEQTEIDALATLQPDLLNQIATDAIKPFWDDTLTERVNEAKDAWRDQANAVIQEQLGDDFAQRLQQTAERLTAIREEAETLCEAINVSDQEFDLPDYDIPDAETDLDAPRPEMVINSLDSFADQTESLQRARDYNRHSQAQKIGLRKAEAKLDRALRKLEELDDE